MTLPMKELAELLGKISDIRVAMVSKDAEIKRLQSRLAAADALLQRTQMKDYDAAEWLRLGRDIATHLQSSDAKREAKG